METFLLIITIVVTLSVLIVIYRLNNFLARPLPTETSSNSGGKAIHLMNIAGKWLTMIGGVATFPLIMMLIFTPSSGSEWLTTLGVLGCFALLIAALILIPTCIWQCLTRKVSVKRLALTAYHVTLKKGLKPYGRKAIWWIVSAILLALFLPYITNLLTFVAYAVGLLFAGRLGLLNNIDDEDESGAFAFSRFYNYSTGKWDDDHQPGGMY